MRPAAPVLWAAVAALGLLSRACDSPAHATPRESDRVLLARICVSEAGWECWETGDGLAIYEVLSTGARRSGLSFRHYARSYASRATGARPTSNARLAWVAGLGEAGERPSAWPRDLSWAHYRPQWLDVLEHAEEVLSLDGARARDWSPCASSVHDWGGRMDEARAVRLGLIPVRCGPTRNAFYARPSLARGTP